VNIPRVVEYVNTLPNVVYVENNLYTCSNDTQDRIKEKIAEHNLNRVVVASCTPRTHEPLFRNALAKVRLSQPLYRQTVRVEKSALVIGGGLSGMTAALALASQGTETYLVEKENELGGSLRHTHYLFNGEKPQDELASLREAIAGDSRIHLFTGAEIQKIEGTIGNFKTTISAAGATTEITHGVVIVATGAKQYRPTEYLYGQDDRVL